MEQVRTHVGDGGGRWSGGNVTRMFTYLSTFAVLAVSANFLARRSEGVEVTDSLNAICEELARRYGVDLCRMRNLKILPDPDSNPTADSFTALLIVACALLLFALLARRSRAHA